ncbi:MAG: DUF4157 domain-containing protein [Chloroflexi bacterium]|nr:DUF4157 domain-containing protein [Chloroflexota bacterium]
MRTYAHPSKTPEQIKSADFVARRGGFVRHNTATTTRLERTQSATLRAGHEQPGGKSPAGKKTSPGTSGISRFEHDFSQVPVTAKPPAALQAKTPVNAPGDIWEQEANRVAEHLLHRPAPATHQAHSALQVERAEPNDLRPVAAPSVTHDVLRSPGQPLDGATRAFMEPRFGRAFRHVRVHTGSKASESARAMNALAYTWQNDIVFGAGQYAPHTPRGQRLLAHELTHVVQQQEQSSASNTLMPIIQRQASQPAQSPTQVSRGTPQDAMFFIFNPNLETDPGLQAALNLLNRYSAHVPVRNVVIRLLPESEQRVVLGMELGGDSFWDGRIPVVRLPQEALDIITRHIAQNASVADVHKVIRTIGHEIHHLWRARERHRANPIQPVYEAEATRRMERVRQNWLRAIQSGTSQIRGVPQTITRWEQIPQSERERIEQGASSTDFIQGLYERSAYIVEEIYTRIEELAFLRIQQRQEPDTPRTPSRGEISELAHVIFRLRNNMDSMVASNHPIVTPQLWRRAQQEMLQYLRRRYPNRQNPRLDSFEVLFFLNAMHSGRPPLFVSGRLQSVPPPGARVP